MMLRAGLCYRWWWLGLNDIEVEGEFVWPVSGPATYTYWDVEYEEPYPGKLATGQVQAGPLEVQDHFRGSQYVADAGCLMPSIKT